MNREFSLRREFRCPAFLIFHLLSVVFVSAVQAGSVPDYVAVNLRTGEQIKLSQHFRNDVLLIVHIPMDCEGKNQFQGLQKLYQRYRDKGFVVLGLLTNGFGPKGPNKAEHFLSDCIEKYQFSFPVGLLENQQSGQGDDVRFFSGSGKCQASLQKVISVNI